MATVHSLVCWGGRTGKQVTFTDAGDVVNSTNHGLRIGARLRLSTDGTLPTGLSIVPAYYVGPGADASKFLLYTTKADAIAGTNQVTFSGAGTGPHYANSVLMEEYFAQYAGRWGDSGAELCYDGLISWHAARTGAVLGIDEEVCELGEAFTEKFTGASYLNLNMPAGAVRVESRVNGVRTEAFHGGQVSEATADGSRYGFVFEATNPGANFSMISMTARNATIDGFTVIRLTTNYIVSGVQLGFGARAINMIARSANSASGSGFYVSTLGPAAKAISCLAVGWGNGFAAPQTVEQYGWYDCIATKNTTGFAGSATNNWGVIVNCLSLGNLTTNWSTSTGFRQATNNFGGTGEAWMTTSGTRIEVTEASPFVSVFVDWANNDLRPASSSAPQVDTAAAYYGIGRYDIADDERPNYNNGGAEAFDVGCYEFDHGFGNHPITATLTLTGLVSGTDVVVRAAGTNTILDSVDSTSGNWTYTYSTTHNVDIDVIKPGMVIVPFRNLALTAASSSLPVSQQFDRNYS